MMMYRVSTKRAARGRRRQPYRQGDLDGLGGVYSAVNAVRALCPEVDDDAASCIFEALLLALPKVDADPRVRLYLRGDRAWHGQRFRAHTGRRERCGDAGLSRRVRRDHRLA